MMMQWVSSTAGAGGSEEAVVGEREEDEKVAPCGLGV